MLNKILNLKKKIKIIFLGSIFSLEQPFDKEKVIKNIIKIILYFCGIYTYTKKYKKITVVYDV